MITNFIVGMNMGLAEFVLGGPLFTIALTTTILLAAQAFFSFQLWRRGDDKYFLRFLTYLMGTITVLLVVILVNIDLILLFEVLDVLGPIVVVLTVILFLKEKWYKKEEAKA